MAINEDKIRKLIKNYEGYKKECMEACTDIGSAKAGLYHVVLHDLNELLPRETLADVAGDDLQPYVGTWVECLGQHALVLTVVADRIFIVCPKQDQLYWRYPNEVYPLDTPRAWDEDGELAY